MKILVIGHIKKDLNISNYIFSIMTRWTELNDNFLKENYIKHTNKKLSEIMNISESTIRYHAKKLKLEKYPCLVDLSKISKEQLSYIAGIIDGEGSLTIRKDKIKKWIILKPIIKIGMTDELTIDKITEWLKNAKFRCNNSVSKREGWKTMYSISITNPKEILELLYALPFIFDKKIQSDILINFCKERIKRKGKSYTEYELSLRNKIMEANK